MYSEKSSLSAQIREGSLLSSRIRLVVILVLSVAQSACSHVSYYSQAVTGHLAIMMKAEPIDKLLGHGDTSPELKKQLIKLQSMRSFASNELGLPKNASYTKYTQLDRPFSIWNVVAAPELSLELKRWCFPVAGCVAYRGYYSYPAAVAYANSLREQGFDVNITGVPAYSTLGWFADPALSSFIFYPDVLLARLLFHELAHQLVYVPGDSRFNEAFATALENEGVERWIAAQGDASLRATFESHRQRRAQFIALLLKHRARLEEIYTSEFEAHEKRRMKADVFAQLQQNYQALKHSWGGFTGYDRWFAQPLSNAHLSSIATYHELVPHFTAMIERETSLDDFYAAVKRLADLPKAKRHDMLTQIK